MSGTTGVPDGMPEVAAESVDEAELEEEVELAER